MESIGPLNSAAVHDRVSNSNDIGASSGGLEALLNAAERANLAGQRDIDLGHGANSARNESKRKQISIGVWLNSSAGNFHPTIFLEDNYGAVMEQDYLAGVLNSLLYGLAAN